MLYRSSLLAIVGTGSNSLFPAGSVVLFDDQSGRTLGNVSVGCEIKDIQMTRQKLAIQTENKIYLYNLSDMSKQLELNCLPNSQFQLSGEKKTKIYYQMETGHINIYDIDTLTDNSIKCHETMVKAFATNGSLLFTMSEKGTLLRGFNVETQEKTLEWRRGYTDCNVFSIAMTQNENPYIATSSDHKTIHIIKASDPIKSEQIKLDYGNWKLSWMNEDQLYCVNTNGQVLLLQVKEDDKKLYINTLDQQQI